MRPLRELKKFERVFVEKGKKTIVNFSLGLKDLGYYDTLGNFTLEKGVFEIYIGENALTERKIEISVI